MKTVLLSLCSLLVAFPSFAESPSTYAYQQGMQQMHQDMNIRYSGQTDTDFARGMVPHHQGAIDMANVVLTHGHDEDVLSLARWIKASQEGEIGQMSNWIRRRAAAEPVVETAVIQADASVIENKAAMAVMHRDMAINYTEHAEHDFVCGMIPHHQGAIDMAKIELRHGRDPEMLRLARKIIPSQSSDIARMQRWLKRHNRSCSLEKAGQHHHH